MGAFDGIAGRCLGYLGLFLIGAISWAGDHLGPAPGVPIRMVSRRRARPDTALRPGASVAGTQRTKG